MKKTALLGLGFLFLGTYEVAITILVEIVVAVRITIDNHDDHHSLNKSNSHHKEQEKGAGKKGRDTKGKQVKGPATTTPRRQHLP